MAALAAALNGEAATGLPKRGENPLAGRCRHLNQVRSSRFQISVHLPSGIRALARRNFASGSELNIAELRQIGQSIEGRPIYVLRIGDRRGGTPKILFMGCHHAREWISVEVPFLLGKELVERADEPEIAGWLSHGEIWVAPMVNPDGHEYCRTTERLWRKNR